MSRGRGRRGRTGLGFPMMKQGNCLEKENARESTRGLDGQHQYVEESIRIQSDRDKWRKYVHGVVSPRIKYG